MATVLPRGLALSVVAIVGLAGCSQSTTGTPAAGAPATSSSAGPTSSSDPTTSAAVGVAVDAGVVETSVLRPMQVESDDFWEEILALAGSSAGVSAPMSFLAESETLDCGGVALSGTDHFGPTYCAAQDEIVVSATFMADLGASQVLQADGTFVDPADDVGVYFLLAHEWGHNIIGELVAEKQADLTLVTSQQVELAADCLAGLMIAGVPRVFAVKDTEAVLGYVPVVGERFAGISGSPAARQAAIEVGLAPDYEDRAQFVTGLDQCLSSQAPQLAKALG